jgi:spermidine/putrescine transport system ATP-binding protein
MRTEPVNVGGPNGTPATETPALSLQGVVKRFGDVVAVAGITFDVDRREFFSLLGPSGCGKTTTLRMLGGFESPTEGRIFFDGLEASRLAPHERDTNMVFQSYALFPHMTVGQNVAFGPQRKRLGRREVEARVRDSLGAVQLDDYAKRYPRELSGGQQQRVALARALANRPAVLLLDEPLGALDLKLREEMQFELKRIQREVGISFVYVTHDQGEALTMSDRIAVMNAGRVEHLGTPEEIYLHPATLFVAGFIGQTSSLPCRVRGVAADRTDVELTGGRTCELPASRQALQRGAAAIVIVRPEHIRLQTDEPIAGVPAVRVRVVDQVFQGSMVRYGLVSPDDEKLAALIPLQDRVDVSDGAEVWATWAPEWSSVLELEGASGR